MVDILGKIISWKFSGHNNIQLCVNFKWHLFKGVLFGLHPSIDPWAQRP